ncbi:MAG: DUF3784 domain-containing protein [Imperialibacter sp.]
MDLLINLIIGGFLIGTGFLVKANPMAIAGYNTMSEEKRKNVDIEGLSSMMRNYLIAMGLLVIAGAFILDWMGWQSMSGVWLIVAVMVPIPFMLIQAQKYDHNKRSPGKYAMVITFVVILFLGTGGFLYYSSQPAQITVDGRTITISGFFGTKAEIESARQVNEIGKIGLKTNGFHMGDVYKGHFMVEQLGECLLFLQSAKGPFIEIVTTDGKKIMVNGVDDPVKKLIMRE